MTDGPIRTEDIAREAGVSRATVSYVLNDRRDVRVSDTTRRRVMDVARRIGYVGSPAARALRSGRGDVVLLLIPGWEVTGQLELLLEQIGRLVAQHNLVCLRYEGAHWQGSLNKVLSHISAACVVTFDPLLEEDAKALQAAGVPEVLARLLDRPGKPHTTAIGQKAIVAAQIDHLLGQGYERLGYLGMNEPRGQQFVEARIAAFDEICRARGLTGMTSTLVDWDREIITEVLGGWVGASPEPLGVVAWNDLAGLGILSAAAELNVRVPDELGVIGGDDTLIAALARPALSSIRLDLVSEAEGIAAGVAKALGRDTQLHAPAGTVVEIIVRESSKRSS
jgi:DNA-binding LacI/PurR family transcriptional regulator